MDAPPAGHTPQITCHTTNCNRLIRNALPYPPSSTPPHFDTDRYCSSTCAARGTQRICALPSCPRNATATISCPHCRGMPQTDPNTVFPNYGYCTKEHLDKDAADHREICAQRQLAKWVRFLDDAVNTACREEGGALFARVVTGGPYFEDVDKIMFQQRSLQQSGERETMFPADMEEFDRQSVLFFNACRHTVRITTPMIALLTQGMYLNY